MPFNSSLRGLEIGSVCVVSFSSGGSKERESVGGGRERSHAASRARAECSAETDRGDGGEGKKSVEDCAGVRVFGMPILAVYSGDWG